MPQKHKDKRKITPSPTEIYQFEIDDWEVSYSFHGKTKHSYTHSNKYDEVALLVLFGEPFVPVYKIVSKVQFYFWAEPKLEDHWTEKPTVEARSLVGHMTVLRDKVTLDISCSIPPRMFNNIQVSLASGKIKFAKVYGEKLRWGKGGVFWISLATKEDDE